MNTVILTLIELKSFSKLVLRIRFVILSGRLVVENLFRGSRADYVCYSMQARFVQNKVCRIAGQSVCDGAGAQWVFNANLVDIHVEEV